MKKHLNRSLLLLMALSLFACKADVELTEVDPTVKVNFGAALPVGEISMKLGDFLGDNLDFGDKVIVREDGVLCFYDTMSMQYSIDEVDVAEYFEPAHAELVVDELIPEKLIEVAEIMGIPVMWKLPGSDEPIVLECPIDLGLGGINTPGSSERIDSVIIAIAEFYGRITAENLDMPFDKIESVELILDPRMKRPGGSIVLAQMDGKDYGQNVPVVIDNCIIDLVKDHSQPLGLDNAVDSLHMSLRFTLSLEKTDTVTIRANSKFVFDFSVNQFDYDAVFGYSTWRSRSRRCCLCLTSWAASRCRSPIRALTWLSRRASALRLPSTSKRFRRPTARAARKHTPPSTAAVRRSSSSRIWCSRGIRWMPK